MRGTVDQGPSQPAVFFTRGADRCPTAGCTQVPTCVLRSPSLSPGAKLLYAVLSHLSDFPQGATCSVDQGTLAAEMGCNRRSVRHFLLALEAAGLVRKTRQGPRRPNVYELLPIPTGGEER